MLSFPWKYNSFCLISFSTKGRRFTIPVPLALAQDFVESVCWILYWALRLTANRRIRAKISEKIPFTLKTREITRILKMPHLFFEELRYCGSMVLLKIKDDDFFIEIRLI